MSTTTQPTPRPLGCPSWCELSPEQHAPAWHDGALRVDHQRVYRVQDVGSVVVYCEASYHPEGAGLRLVLGPVGASCEAIEETLDAAGLRSLASALVEAAALVEALHETAPDAVAASCAAGHAFTLGRCARCGAIAPGVEVPGVSSGGACQVLRCCEPAVWRVTFGHSSPVDPRGCSADYCEGHAVGHDGLSSVAERVRIGGQR